MSRRTTPRLHVRVNRRFSCGCDRISFIKCSSSKHFTINITRLNVSEVPSIARNDSSEVFCPIKTNVVQLNVPYEKVTENVNVGFMPECENVVQQQNESCKNGDDSVISESNSNASLTVKIPLLYLNVDGISLENRVRVESKTNPPEGEINASGGDCMCESDQSTLVPQSNFSNVEETHEDELLSRKSYLSEFEDSTNQELSTETSNRDKGESSELGKENCLVTVSRLNLFVNSSKDLKRRYIIDESGAIRTKNLKTAVDDDCTSKKRKLATIKASASRVVDSTDTTDESEMKGVDLKMKIRKVMNENTTDYEIINAYEDNLTGNVASDVRNLHCNNVSCITENAAKEKSFQNEPNKNYIAVKNGGCRGKKALFKRKHIPRKVNNTVNENSCQNKDTAHGGKTDPSKHQIWMKNTALVSEEVYLRRRESIPRMVKNTVKDENKRLSQADTLLNVIRGKKNTIRSKVKNTVKKNCIQNSKNLHENEEIKDFKRAPSNEEATQNCESKSDRLNGKPCRKRGRPKRRDKSAQRDNFDKGTRRQNVETLNLKNSFLHQCNNKNGTSVNENMPSHENIYVKDRYVQKILLYKTKKPREIQEMKLQGILRLSDASSVDSPTEDFVQPCIETSEDPNSVQINALERNGNSSISEENFVQSSVDIIDDLTPECSENLNCETEKEICLRKTHSLKDDTFIVVNIPPCRELADSNTTSHWVLRYTSYNHVLISKEMLWDYMEPLVIRDDIVKTRNTGNLSKTIEFIFYNKTCGLQDVENCEAALDDTPDSLCKNARYKCGYCGNMYKYKNSISQHISFHTKNSSTYALQSHRKLERNYECDLCGKLFPSKAYLIPHFRNVHRDPYKCCYCDKVYSCKKELLLHIRDHTRLLLLSSMFRFQQLLNV